MPRSQLPPDPSEVGRLGRELYDAVVRPRLRPEDDGKYVAIDVDTGDYEVDPSDYAAVMQLRGRRAGARVWLERAGWSAAVKVRSLGRGPGL